MDASYLLFRRIISLKKVRDISGGGVVRPMPQIRIKLNSSQYECINDECFSEKDQ